MRPPTAVLLAAALVAVAATAGAYEPDPAPETPVHRLEAAGLVAGDPAPEFLSEAARDTLPGDDPPPVPAEATLEVASPVQGEPGNVGDRRAEATLTLRPATAHAAHPLYDDLHSPTVLDVEVEWTKEPVPTDPVEPAPGWTVQWVVHLEATVLDEPLDLSGSWTPASSPLVCTLDVPPSSCTHEGAGPVHLQGAWGSADVVLDGAASDRFCTYAGGDGVPDGYVERTAESC